MFCHCSSLERDVSSLRWGEISIGVYILWLSDAVSQITTSALHTNGTNQPLPQKETETTVFLLQAGRMEAEAQYCAGPLTAPRVQTRSAAALIVTLPIHHSGECLLCPQPSPEALSKSHHSCLRKEKSPK